ncbi:hypothetical protein NPIL_425371 [Nephila pilipes]|uniref:C2H2-type domain-containing protein n=1 Tax=Nephila pilipes TaxID=299642 RepID=A0A8X6TEL0_NEPPI|nr:hypothetical protein NPIL_425371 [Nephila pilipes]
MVVHGIKDKKNFICRYCEKPFSKKFNLQRHIKSVHKVDVQQKIDLTGAESECPIEENCGDPMETSMPADDALQVSTNVGGDGRTRKR